MQAWKVASVLNDLTRDYDNNVNITIDCVNFTTHFIICEKTAWSYDEQGCLLTLVTPEGAEFIDTDSITRISV